MQREGGLELNLLAIVPQFPCLVSGFCPVTSEASVPPSHHTVTSSPLLTFIHRSSPPRLPPIPTPQPRQRCRTRMTHLPSPTS